MSGRQPSDWHARSVGERPEAFPPDRSACILGDRRADNAVAAARLGGIESGVCHGIGICKCGAATKLGNAETCGHTKGFGQRVESEVGQVRSQARRQLTGTRCICSGQKQAELFPADTAGDVAASGLSVQECSDPTDNLVACDMAVFIIDRLEVIYVDNDERGGYFSRPGVAIVARRLLKSAAGLQTCQVIVIGILPKVGESLHNANGHQSPPIAVTDRVVTMFMVAQ